jgi:dimethylargininase
MRTIMLTAITRSPGPELARCELTHLDRRPIDLDLALAQHAGYRAALRAAGLTVVELPADPVSPDGVFVEDTAVVLDEVAVLTSPTASRRGECAAIEAALRPFRPIARLADGRLEGGDVLRVGRVLYVGLSTRTDERGVRSLEGVVGPLGYRVVPVRVDGCLHLKSAACALDDETVLVNCAWADVGAFAGIRLLEVPAAEPFGANVLRLPGRILVSETFPRTADAVGAAGHDVAVIDVSELHKAESGLTCMSLVFRRLAGE